VVAVQRSSEGDSCSLYDLNSYCTADGREGPGWETCANGNITSYADSNGVTPLQACCACGGGTAPAPPAPSPPPTPLPSKCTGDHSAQAIQPFHVAPHLTQTACACRPPEGLAELGRRLMLCLPVEQL
jgi:hypothetical protein